MEQVTKQSSTHEELCRDPQRAAYMLAWRDRYIRRLEETLAGREEERALLCALLQYALQKGAGASCEIAIDKAELKALLGGFTCAVEDGENAYTVRFLPQEKERRDAAEQES